MSRNFGIMSGSASLRGASTDRPALREELTRNSIQLPDVFPPDASWPNSRDSNRALFTPSIEDQEFAAKWFGTCCIASPFVIFGICYLVIRVFE